MTWHGCLGALPRAAGHLLSSVDYRTPFRGGHRRELAGFTHPAEYRVVGVENLKGRLRDRAGAPRKRLVVPDVGSDSDRS